MTTPESFGPHYDFYPDRGYSSGGSRDSRLMRFLDTAENITLRGARWGGKVISWIGAKSIEGIHSTARWAYEQGPMKWWDTEWIPVFFDEGTPRQLVDNLGVVTISVPFKFKEPDQKKDKWIPAINKGRVLRLSDSNFPHLLVSFEDPHRDRIGDEILRLQPMGAARDAFTGQEGALSWRLYLPGDQEIGISGGGHVIKKPQAEMTAGDVVEMLVNRICDQSGGRIYVPNRNLHVALRMITEKSPALDKRWELLDDRLEFQMNLVTHHHQIAMLFRSMVDVPREEFTGFLEKLQNGQIIGWASFLREIDTIKQVTVTGGGSVVPRLLYSGVQTVPRPQYAEEMATIPTSVFVSLPGLKYFNAVIDGYKKRIEPLMAKIADRTVAVQEESMAYVRDYLKLKEAGWGVARKQLTSQQGPLERSIAAQVNSQIDRLIEEMTQQIGGATIHLTPGLPEGTDRSGGTKTGSDNTSNVVSQILRPPITEDPPTPHKSSDKRFPF